MPEYREAIIDVSGAGDHTVLPAVNNKSVRVYGLFLVNRDEVDLTFKSGADPLTGNSTVAAAFH